MTQVATPPATAGADRPVPEGHVRLTIDGITVDAPKGELVIRSAERIGIAIPRFCDHPLLEPVGACRQCLVEVEMGGRAMPKPQAACTQAVADGMVVKTQLTSPVAEKAQRGNLEFLLLNHPLDCPICDKGGECPLQNQTMANGAATSRMHDAKRVFSKPIAVSTEILLDRERCVLCQRCTRFSAQIAGDPFIELLERGSLQQIGINADEPFQSYFSGNTIQICPVGALTSAAYRFRARPFDLVSTTTACEHCAAGCALRTDHRAGVVTRRLASADPEVNEEWNCDKGRFGFTYLREPDRITTPLIRSATTGELEPASWTDAMAAAAAGLTTARDNGGVGVLAGGRLTLTDAYAYAKFARVALRTNDVDFRSRAHSVEEERFLLDRVVGRGPDTGGVSYRDLDQAPAVLLVALEPEEESPILFLRLRKAARRGVPVLSLAALRSRGLEKLSGTLVPALPGDEPELLADLAAEAEPRVDVPHAAERNRAGQLLRTGGAVVLVGERAAEVPGLLTAVGNLVDATGARLAWVPRRAGDRGAVEAGLLPSLLPGGHPVADPAARAKVENIWGVSLPAEPGRDLAGILAAVGLPEEPDVAGGTEGTDEVVVADLTDPVDGDGPLAGLLIGGVDLADLPDPSAAVAAVAAAGFVVSLELRATAVTEFADVVFPVAAAPEKSGAFLNWEGRYRPFDRALEVPGRLDEGRILDTLGVEMDVDLYTQTAVAARADMGRLGSWLPGPARALPGGIPDPAAHRARRDLDAGRFVLATWRMGLDGSRMLDGEPHLAGTAKPEVVRLSAAAAARMDLAAGDEVRITGPSGGSVRLPLAVTEMLDDVAWVPAHIRGTPIGAVLGAHVGDVVSIAPSDDPSAGTTGGAR